MFLTESQWQEYNEYGILDIIEFHDPRPKIIPTDDSAVVQYRIGHGHNRGVWTRALRKDDHGWYSVGEDQEA